MKSTIAKLQLALVALTLFALWFVLCRQLSGEWSVNDQYSYGWFVPFFAAFLFWLRWEDRPETGRRGGRSEVESQTRIAHAKPVLAAASSANVDGTQATRLPLQPKKGKGIAIGVAILALLLLLPIRLFEVANPDWRPLDWIHAATVVTLTLLAVWAAGGWAWVRHFAFPICFIFVAVPWLSAIEEPIVQGLMRLVAAVATETLTLFGVPAQLEGNLIRVSSGLVGVNEACSGVRSLQTSLMIGLLFGELKRLSVARRLLLIGGALAIAILANFGRAFFLVWIAATENVAAVDRWHDLAGYTIVGVVFVGSLVLAAMLAKGHRGKTEVERRKAKVESAESPVRSASFLLSPFSFGVCLVWLLAVEIGVDGWYQRHERGMVASEQWTARWPEKAPNFRDIHIDETTKRILRFDEGRGATWRVPKTDVGARKPEEGGDESALLYFFRWKPGGNSALLANLHRPDVCLPASGWVQLNDFGIRSYRVTENFSLPFRHFLFAQTAAPGRQRFAHAFYCLREDRVRNDLADSPAREPFASEPSEWSRRERVSLVMQGRRHLGQQVMEFVLLTREDLGREQAEAQFASLVREMVERK